MIGPTRSPADLEIVIDRAPIAFTPCWVVYAAMVQGRAAVAARLLPELCAVEPRVARLASNDSRTIAALPDRVLDPVFAADVEVLGGRLQEALGALPTPSIPLARDLALGYSVDTASFWLAYAIEPGSLAGALSPASATRPFAPRALALFDAVELFHARGIWHCDISPSLVLPDGTLLLPGASLRAIARSNADQMLVTRPGYSAPELYDLSAASEIGPWTDIHMASATLYTLATGVPPPTPAERRRDPTAFRKGIIASIASQSEHAPFAEAIAAGMSLRIGERPQSVAAWRALIDQPALEQMNLKVAVPAQEIAPETVTRTMLEPGARDGDAVADRPAMDAVGAVRTLDAVRISFDATAAGAEPVPYGSVRVSVSIGGMPVTRKAVPIDSPGEAISTYAVLPSIRIDELDHEARRRPRARRAWIMIIGIAGILGGAAFWILQQSAPPLEKGDVVVEGTPTPVAEPIAPSAPEPAPSPTESPVPAPSLAPLPEPTAKPGPTATPLPLTQVEGRWRRAGNAACDTAISAGDNRLDVAIGRTRYTHRIIDRDGDALQTRMSGDAEGEFTIRLKDGGEQLSMSLVGGESENWTKCGELAGDARNPAPAARKEK